MARAPRTTGDFPYRSVSGWGEALVDAGLSAREYADVAVTVDDRVLVLARQPSFIAVLDPAGHVLGSFGHGELSDRPHGVTAAHDGRIYVVDSPAHIVRVFTGEGRLEGSLGSGEQSDTGVDDSLPVPSWTGTVARAAGPFNHPTKAAAGPDGTVYVADGYGNARIHRFSPDGELLSSWGRPGVGSGEFKLPHSVTVLRDGTVIVADREADRLQLFTPEGDHLETWAAVRRPTAVAERSDGTLVVSELAWRAGEVSHRRGTLGRGSPARLTLLDRGGGVLGRFGNPPGEAAAGRLSAPHGLAVDSADDLYVAEVTASFTGRPQSPTLQKFQRTPA